MASSRAASSAGSVWRMASSVVGLDFELVCVALHDEHGAVELAHLHAVLVRPHGLHRDDARAGAALRFALLQHLGAGIERVAGVERMGKLDVGPAEVGDRLLA